VKREERGEGRGHVGNVSRQGGRGELAAGENKSRRIGFR